MSTVLAPAQFISIAGQTVLLPPNARPDLAFQRTVVDAAASGSSYTVLTVDGRYIQLLAALSFIWGTADNAAGAPFVYCRSVDNPNIPAWTAVGSLSQPMGTQANYMFSASVSSSFVETAAQTTVVAPLPLLPLFSEQTVEVIGGGTPGHLPSIQGVASTIVYVPTGPDLADESPELVAAPLVL